MQNWNILWLQWLCFRAKKVSALKFSKVLEKFSAYVKIKLSLGKKSIFEALWKIFSSLWKSKSSVCLWRHLMQKAITDQTHRALQIYKRLYYLARVLRNFSWVHFLGNIGFFAFYKRLYHLGFCVVSLKYISLQFLL